MSAAVSRPDHARELRHALTDPYELCARLELLAGIGTFKRQAGGVIIRCPVHEERTPSCSVRVAPDGTIGWKCFGCQAGGDALGLIAQVHGLTSPSEFPQVLRAAAELSGQWQILEELNARGDAPKMPTTPRPIIKPPAPPPERTYPEDRQVARMFSESIPVSEDASAQSWLASRGLDADLVAADDLARVIRNDAPLPRWARYQGASWIRTGHRLIIPMFDATGTRRSVRSTRIDETGLDAPKRLPPAGHKSIAVVMACPIALAMLRGTSKPSEVVIVEGEPDFLTWATRRTKTVTARIGIVNGSWSFEFAKRISPGAKVWIRTDHDAAGNRYADDLTRTLRWAKCFPFRGGHHDEQ